MLLIVGLWRFLDAFDDAVLDRWTRARAEDERLLPDKAAKRAARATASGE